MKLDRILLLAGAVAVTACGTATAPSADTRTVQAYQALGQQMADSVTTYQTETSTMQDPAACQAAWDTYHAQMAAQMTHMQELSGTMDGMMDGTTTDGMMGGGMMGGHLADPDMTCAADLMAAELARHASAACAAADVTADRAEAADHVATMTMLMEHQRVRYEDMATTMGMMSPTSDTTWTCQENPDGTFTMGDSTWTPSAGTSPDPAPTDTTPTPAPWPSCGCRDGSC